jgi:hypothetical protein
MSRNFPGGAASADVLAAVPQPARSDSPNRARPGSQGAAGVSSVAELAERAARLGFRLCRWTDPAAHPLSAEPVTFALRAKNGRDVRVGSAQDVARVLDALEEKAAA